MLNPICINEEKMVNEKLIAACGLDCKKCGAYIALQNNDEELRIKTAQEWTEQFGHSFAPADINCSGCLVNKGIHGGYCSACPLRSCAINKNVANCYVCPEFKECKNVKDFEKHSGMNVANNFISKDFTNKPK